MAAALIMQFAARVRAGVGVGCERAVVLPDLLAAAPPRTTVLSAHLEWHCGVSGSH